MEWMPTLLASLYVGVFNLIYTQLKNYCIAYLQINNHRITIHFEYAHTAFIVGNHLPASGFVRAGIQNDIAVFIAVLAMRNNINFVRAQVVQWGHIVDYQHIRSWFRYSEIEGDLQLLGIEHGDSVVDLESV